jgi:hypothetical protein
VRIFFFEKPATGGSDSYLNQKCIYTIHQKNLLGLHQWSRLQTKAPQDFLRARIRASPNFQGGLGFLPALWG